MNRAQHLIIDEEAAACFRTQFPRRHFRLRHDLVGHPLLSLDRLLELALALPRQYIEYNTGDLPVSHDPQTMPGSDLSLEATIRRIADCGSWVVLKYVEHDPAYRRLLAECVAEIAPLSEPRAPGTRQLEGYVFISSPGSVTPFHFDDEHNFLLQIAGSKVVHGWDPEVVGYRDVERYYGGAHRNLPYRDGLDEHCRRFELKPGDGLHIPVHSPHWVKNGPAVSISFSITFRSAPLAREAAVHWLNARLRRRGLPARPYGRSALADSAKYQLVRLARRLRA